MSRMTPCFRASCVALAMAGMIPRIARAEGAAATTTPRPSEGTVIALDSGDLVLDIGAAKGLHDGDLVELWRPLRVRHPVTGQMLVDRFRIGTVKLTQVQKTMSLGHVEGDALRAPAAGDAVRTTVPEPLPQRDAEAVYPTPGPTRIAAPAPSCAPSDPEAEELSRLFTALRGAAPEARVAAYQTFVRARPKSRFAAVLTEEANALGSAKREGAPVAAAPRPYEVSSDPPQRLRPGVPQPLAVELDRRFVGGVVHVRREGTKGYRSVPMRAMGAHYFAGTLPGDAIDDGGAQYFVEGVLSDGTAVPVVGTASAPREVEVERPPFMGKRRGTIAEVQLTSELASFNTKAPNDYMFQTEGQSSWRLGDVGVRAVRSGFGVIRGKGGLLSDLDAGRSPTDIGLTYGYVEAEWGLSHTYAIVTRPIIGLQSSGVAGGAQGFLRIGNDLETNLLVGGEILGGVGLRGVVQLEWRTIPRVPIALRSEVTNQPAGVFGDVGIRTIAQVGYEVTSGLVVSARGSFQGRTINHAGPGGGLGVSYQW